MPLASPKKFMVALTADFFDSAGRPKFPDLGLSVFAGHAHLEHRTLAEHRPQIGPDQIGDASGVIVLTPAVTAETVSHAENLLAIGRFGVGYDSVNVPACTAADGGATPPIRSVQVSRISWIGHSGSQFS